MNRLQMVWMIALVSLCAVPSASLIRERFEDQLPGLRDSAQFEARANEAPAGVSLVSNLARIDVCVQPVAGPSVPCERLCFQNQLTRPAANALLVAEYRAVDSGLARIADELPPHEQRPCVRGEQEHLFTGAGALFYLSTLTGAVVPLEQRHDGRVSIAHRYPDISPIKEKRLFRHGAILTRAGVAARMQSRQRANGGLPQGVRL